MKKVKIILIALVVMLVTMLIVNSNIAYGATRVLNRQDERPYSDDNGDGTIGNDYYQIQREGPKLYRFVKIYDTANTTKNGNSETFNNFIYCLRAGVGFGSTVDGNSGTSNVNYNEIGEMHENANAIIDDYLASYSTSSNKISKTGTVSIKASNGITYNVNLYNAILWIADNAYLPLNMNNYIAAEYKEELLDKIGVAKVNRSLITDDDIEVVQQLAFWYFANYDEQASGDGSSLSIASKMPFAGGGAITVGANTIGTPRALYLDRLYNYFIDNAIENSDKYGTDNVRKITEPTLSFDKTLEFKFEEGTVGSGAYTAYKIGPFKISGTGTIDESTFYLTDANDNIIYRYKYLNSALTQATKVYDIVASDTGTAISSMKDLEAGKEYYVYLYKLYEGRTINEGEDATYDFSEVTFNLGASYTLSNAKFLSTGSTNDQALVEIEKDKVQNGDKITTKKPKVSDFSLNLTKVKTGTNTKLAGAKFKLVAGTWDANTKAFTATGTENEFGPTESNERDVLKLIENQAITQDGTYKPGTYYFRLTESVTPEGYLGLEDSIIIKIVITENTNGFAVSSKLIDGEGNEVTSIQGVATISVDGTTNTISLIVENKEVVFDLSLRKYITGLQTSEGITKGIFNKEGNSNTRSLNSIDTAPLNTGRTTADYKHRKDPVVVETGDIVTYTLRVYNEGDIDGYVTEIKDILPEGVEFYPIGLTEVESTDANIKIWNKTETETLEDRTQTIETTYTFNKTTRELAITRTNMVTFTVPTVGLTAPEDYVFFLEAYDQTKESDETRIHGLDYGELSFKCKVVATSQNADTVLTNIARITGDRAQIEGDKDDRDSEPQTFTRPTDLSSYKGTTALTDLSKTDTFYTGQQDDDDFEKLVILGKKFDLSLRKFITNINGEELDESRLPELDMTPLETGSKTTARYIHPKEPVVVKQGDIVTYTIRVYNEGARDGYVTEVTDYLPEGLGLIVGYNTNVDNNWRLQDGARATKLEDLPDVYKACKNKLDLDEFSGIEELTSLKDVQIVEGKIAITSNLLQNSILKAYDSTKTEKQQGENWQKGEEGTTGLYYEDIEVTCIVLAPNSCKDVLKNIAEITGAKDENGMVIRNVGDDRDSEPKTVNEESYHNSVEDRGYFPGEQDDDDFEPLILQYFDLALRKFITGVNETEVTSRIPKLSINEETGNIKYTHPKEEAPVEVQNNDEVTYTIRIFNEGTKAGYADLVADDIPEGLVFLPANKTNKEYRWVMYKEVGEVVAQSTNITDELVWIDGKYYVETDDPEEADMIQTDYLSMDQGEERMQDDDTENPALLHAFDPTKDLADGNPDYKDLKVVFRVTEPNTSDRVIVNSAQITHDTDENGDEIDDEDSETNEWNEGEDDQDKEYIKVKYFDLSLYKWVTKTIVTVDGKTTTTETGFTPNIGKTINVTDMDVRNNEEAEPIAGVVLDKRKLNRTSVKFAYSIMVMNEGEIAGSATEITDYIPEGLEFIAEDNTAYGWESAGDGKITTRCLDGVVLEPGESKAIEVVFTWINSQDNLGLKTNIAEISEDFNESGTPDIDSVPNNKYDEYNKEQEDDDDFALVILQLETGSAPTYIALVTAFLAIVGAGTILIKKYVL